MPLMHHVFNVQFFFLMPAIPSKHNKKIISTRTICHASLSVNFANMSYGDIHFNLHWQTQNQSLDHMHYKTWGKSLNI
jgi:hypothetical protein